MKEYVYVVKDGRSELNVRIFVQPSQVLSETTVGRSDENVGVDSFSRRRHITHTSAATEWKEWQQPLQMHAARRRKVNNRARAPRASGERCNVPQERADGCK